MTHGHGRPMIFFVLKLKSRLQNNRRQFENDFDGFA